MIRSRRDILRRHNREMESRGRSRRVGRVEVAETDLNCGMLSDRSLSAIVHSGWFRVLPDPRILRC
jgi:hypothetical protein